MKLLHRAYDPVYCQEPKFHPTLLYTGIEHQERPSEEGGGGAWSLALRPPPLVWHNFGSLGSYVATGSQGHGLKVNPLRGGGRGVKYQAT